jgi:hypothetical protein
MWTFVIIFEQICVGFLRRLPMQEVKVFEDLLLDCGFYEHRDIFPPISFMIEVYENPKARIFW